MKGYVFDCRCSLVVSFHASLPCLKDQAYRRLSQSQPSIQGPTPWYWSDYQARGSIGCLQGTFGCCASRCDGLVFFACFIITIINHAEFTSLGSNIRLLSLLVLSFRCCVKVPTQPFDSLLTLPSSSSSRATALLASLYLAA